MEIAAKPQARHTLTILAVEDLAGAVRFYTAAFGWPQVVDVPVYAEFALPEGMRLGLYERQGFGRNTGQVPARLPPDELAPTELYFHVDDIADALARLQAAGARLLSALAVRDWGDEAAYFADPEGNVLVVARPLSTAGCDDVASLRELVNRWMSLWQGGDLGLAEELHAPGFIDHSSAGRAADREGFRDGIIELRRAFPDFHAVTKDVLVDVERRTVVVRWRATGTHLGSFLGIAATGRRVHFRGIEIVRIEEGRLVERWGEWDGIDLLHQLGAETG